MTISSKSGSFQTGTGAATTTVAVTGSGFTPNMILFHWVGRTEAVDAIGAANYTQGWGFAAGAGDQRAATTTSINAGASSDGGMYINAANCIAVCDAAGAVTGLLALQSFDADGFTLVVNDAMPASITVQWWAFGGLTNVVTGMQTLAASTTGNVSVTGLAFAPDFGFFISIPDSSAIPFSKGDRCMLGFGVALSSSAQAVIAGGQDDGSANMDTGAYLYNAEVSAVQSVTTPTSLLDRASFVSWNSDGYTVNVLEKDANARRVFYMVCKGASWGVNGITTVNDITTDIVVSGLAFAPQSGMVFSANRALSTQVTPTSDHRPTFGFFNSTSSRSALAILDENGTANAEITTAAEFDEVYIRISTASAIEALMDVKSMDSGGVTFIMDDDDPTLSHAIVVTVGEAAAAAASLILNDRAQRFQPMIVR